MKIIPYFTKIYSVTLYIGQDNKPTIAYSAYNIFNKDRKSQNLQDKPKLHFTDIDSANLCLATKIYPNIVWDAIVENTTFTGGIADEEVDYTAIPGNGYIFGNECYFAGTKNQQDHYFGFYMAREKLIRKEILKKYNLGAKQKILGRMF